MPLPAFLIPLILAAAGTAATGAVGGKKALFGSEGGPQQYDTMRPEQLQQILKLLQQVAPAQESGMSRLSDLLKPGGGQAGDAFAAPYMRQFNEQVVPGLSERFAGAGSHGAMSSSGLSQQLGLAGGRLSESLAAMREQLGQNALGMLPGFMGMGMQPTFGTMYQQPQAGLVPGAVGSLLGGIGGGLGPLLASGGMGGAGRGQQMSFAPPPATGNLAGGGTGGAGTNVWNRAF